MGIFLFCILTITDGLEQGICQICPTDHFCTASELNACPPGATSLVGSNSLGDCVNAQTTTTPTAQITESTVTFTASLQMTLAEFNSTVRDAYVNGVALALSIQVYDVAIGTVTEVVARRRLLTTSIEVETILTVPSSEAETMANLTTTDSLSVGLGPGIPVGDVSAPIIETVEEEAVMAVTSTPPPPDGSIGTDTTPPPEPEYVPPLDPPPPPVQGEWVTLDCE